MHWTFPVNARLKCSANERIQQEKLHISNTWRIQNGKKNKKNKHNSGWQRGAKHGEDTDEDVNQDEILELFTIWVKTVISTVEFMSCWLLHPAFWTQLSRQYLEFMLENGFCWPCDTCPGCSPPPARISTPTPPTTFKGEAVKIMDGWMDIFGAGS